MAEDMACGDDSFFVSRIVQAILLSQGAFANFWSNRKSATWSHVFVNYFGFVRWISLRFCQRGVNTLRNDMVQALEPREFIEGGKW